MLKLPASGSRSASSFFNNWLLFSEWGRVCDTKDGKATKYPDRVYWALALEYYRQFSLRHDLKFITSTVIF